MKYMSIITYISAGGELLRPYIVISQEPEPLLRRLMNRGVRLDVDFVLRQRSKPYINGQLFLEYINNIFIPYLNKLRESEEFTRCEAVLLMDNCSRHMSEAVIAVLTRERVIVITFSPHTTSLISSKCLM
jgi:hypothetical protein